jgi:quinol monooxygenase YgiN
MRSSAATFFLSLTMACAQTTRSTAAAPVNSAAVKRSSQEENKGMIVRLSEIDIDPSYLDEYQRILKEEAEASVRLEPGVIAIFPMHRQDDPNAVRILEIYASRQAYESHIESPHFQKYKTTTLHMVKGLRLVDMNAIDAETMANIFTKL